METPEPDLIHATGCKHPSLRLFLVCLKELSVAQIIQFQMVDDK
jgi:hypothetical protein